MSLSLKNKEKIITGLDIGSQAIKLAQVKFVKDSPELCAFEVKPAQAGLSESIRELKLSYDFEEANISLSGPATVIRYVNFPRMSQLELQQALKFEAQKNIPFSIEEVNFSGNILKDDLPDNKMLVVIAAAKKELINQRLKVMQDCSVKVNLIDIDSLCLVNAFNFNYQDTLEKNKAVALLNIGSSVSNLDILENNIPRLSRDIHLAGDSLTQKLMDIFAMDFKTAENLKFNQESDKANKIMAAVESVLTALSAEIRTSFDFFESQSSTSVGKILLSGGTSNLKGLKETLANLLGIEVDYWDPFKKFTLSDKVEAAGLKTFIPQFAVAAGLALRRI